MPRDRKRTITIATIAAITPLTDGHTPILMPTQNTKTVTATAAAITKPSFSLIDGMRSSGRRMSRSLDVDVRERPVGERAVHDAGSSVTSCAA